MNLVHPDTKRTPDAFALPMVGEGRSIQKRFALMLAGAAFCLIAGSGHLEAALFDDGGVHTIVDGSYASEAIVVTNGTTLKVVDGAMVSRITLYDTARLEMSGGVLDGAGSSIEAWGSASVELSGGSYGPADPGLLAGNVRARDHASLLISGGTFGGVGERSGQVVGRNDATVSITGGAFGGAGRLSGFIDMVERNVLSIEGGLFGSTGRDSGKVNVRPEATVSVSGGTFDEAGLGAGRLTISGTGTLQEATFLNGARLESILGGYVTISGSGFNYPSGPIGDLEGTLTGISVGGASLIVPFFRGNPGEVNGTIEVIDLGNTEPIADAGADEVVECQGAFTSVILDGSASSDPDGDLLSYEWSVPEGVLLDDPHSVMPTGQFPLGPSLVTLTVSDGRGGVATDDVLITVEDTTAPVVVCTTDLISLRPPDHSMRRVQICVVVTDECSEVTLSCQVSSSEPDDAKGDGQFTGDVDGLDGYTLPVEVVLTYDSESECFLGEVDLRAERDGRDRGRVYSIVCEVFDAVGNTAQAGCVVVVPHDGRRQR